MPEPKAPSTTPDGRYIIVRGRLWRASNPALPGSERQRLVDALMAARRAVKEAGGDENLLRAARDQVDTAKRALGERGPVWWNDGAADLNRHRIENTPYRDWYHDMTDGSRGTDGN
nr:hypothetical protein [Rhizobium halophytocola]